MKMKRVLEKHPPHNETSRSPLCDGTICAIATPVGEGGIGIIRLSGDRAIEIASHLFRSKSSKAVHEFASHTLHLGVMTDPATGESLDEVMLAVMRAPRTYTRADTVEIYCHGGALILHRILDLLIRHGARPAEPGEFTQWAFLSGRIDLTQAEAVMDLIRARTSAGQRAAMAQLGGALHQRVIRLREEGLQLLAEIEAGIDFSEEDIQFVSSDQVRTVLRGLIHQVDALLETAASGKALREGVATAIVGRPNVGKSSLLNALLMQNRAIVTPVPGTTRDVIEEYLNLDGVPLRIMDTAGLRETEELVEREGILRTRQAIDAADLVLFVLDATQNLHPGEGEAIEGTAGKQRLLIFNKMDLIPPEERAKSVPWNGMTDAIGISALTGEGLERLREAITGMIRGGIVTCGEREAMVNNRHKALLLQVKQSMTQVAKSLEAGASAELVAMDLRAAIDRLGEITGATTTDDLLDKIFKGFCIGK